MVVLDTDLLIAYLRDKENGIEIIHKIQSPNTPLKTTVFNVAELYKGCYSMRNVAKGLMKVKTLLESLNNILAFDDNSIQTYAKISADLKKRGLMMGSFDELIASICIANNEIFYTGNIQHFKRIKEMTLINWREIEID
ncbi:MAG: type II toxin-antitoxin system VapC family toxin [Promethearchaeota archaeon]